MPPFAVRLTLSVEFEPLFREAAARLERQYGADSPRTAAGATWACCFSRMASRPRRNDGFRRALAVHQQQLMTARVRDREA
ncbi:MAG: hypothetical protein R2724_29625 [Bryobacterales bacterium]